VQHTIWRVGGADRDALVAAFARIPSLYIADGHHRAASAARARDEMRQSGLPGHALGDGADAATFLAVAFPHDEFKSCVQTVSPRISAGSRRMIF